MTRPAEMTFSSSTDVIAGERIYETTNTGRSRVVSLDAGTATVLREHRHPQRKERMTTGPLWVDSEHVFTTIIGEPVHPDTVTQLMRDLIRAYNEPALPGRGHPRKRLPSRSR